MLFAVKLVTLRRTLGGCPFILSIGPSCLQTWTETRWLTAVPWWS